jgi:A/G-specific adenine glycosylase
VSTSNRRARLLAWYDVHRRDLPWRHTSDPYPILVSEIMLQQTQAGRVVPRYERFLARFPTVEALATASVADVLDEWSGLGYNRRAMNLRAAAEQVAAGGWPRSVEGLQVLPGVGPYTAAAVASFAFGVPVAAVDTNLRRVLSRWQGVALGGRRLREAAAAELDRDRPSDWNQALMDLGSMVCTPSTPDCGRCPVDDWCADPTVVTRARPQGRFEGSTRQARGAVVRALVESGSLDAAGLADVSGLARERVEAAAQALVTEGLVVERSGSFTLPREEEPHGMA